jgi:hypothetical protein
MALLPWTVSLAAVIKYKTDRPGYSWKNDFSMSRKFMAEFNDRQNTFAEFNSLSLLSENHSLPIAPHISTETPLHAQGRLLVLLPSYP